MPAPTRITRWRWRRQQRRRQSGLSRLHSVGILLLLLALAGGLLAVGGFSAAALAYASLTEPLPAFAAIPRPEPAATTTAEFYARDNSDDLILIYKVADPRPTNAAWLPLDVIPEVVVDATIAATEPDFFDPEGGDLAATLALLQGDFDPATLPIAHQVILNNLSASSTDEDSAFRNPHSTLERIRAALLVQRLTNSYSREQILEWHLNTAYYGQLAYGIAAAANAYFDKPVADLSLAEAAMLAALPTDPAANPLDDSEAARAGQTAVLAVMERAGFINEQALTAAELTIVTPVSPLADRFDVIAPHFALFAQRWLEAELGPAALLHGELKVTTTLDLTLQRQAECVLQAQVNRLSGQIGAGLPADERDSCPALTGLSPLPAAAAGVDHAVDHAALIALEPATAVIRAMVGDVGVGGQLLPNLAVVPRHQPGTLLQPIVYLTALSQGYSAATMVFDLPPQGTATGMDWPSKEEYFGPLRLREALGNGLIIPALEVTGWVGTDRVVRTARSLGIRSLEPASGRYGIDLSWRGGAVSLLEMVAAYGVLGNMGEMVGAPTGRAVGEAEAAGQLHPVGIVRVETAVGDLLYEYEPQTREILPPQLAYLMNDLLADRSARCRTYGCPNGLELPENRLAAAKSGESADGRSAWTVGYTPGLALGVWLGSDSGRSLNDLNGMDGAAPVWRALMSWQLAGEPARLWPQPVDLVTVTVCDISGRLPTPHCPTVSELFIPGTQPVLVDTIYQEVSINRANGRLATLYTPPELIETRIFRRYPPRAAAWAEANGIPQPPTEYDTLPVDALTSDGRAAITAPAPLATVSGVVTITGRLAADNFASYRLAYFQGLTPQNLQTITETAVFPAAEVPLAVWDVGNLEGLYTLLLTARYADGTFAEVSVPVTVDNRLEE